MALSKIHVQIGDFSFSGEGEEEWLASQLDRIFDRTEEVISFIQHSTKKQSLPEKNDDETRSFLGDIEKKTLASFLKEKASKSQVDKFLATAVWLHAKGNKLISTSDVTKALKDASQKRLSNASDCLSKNIEKGFCEKQNGGNFYVTQEGMEHLNIK